ncbi:hypothetical protein [Streptomyces sp. NPDC057280]|uniref:hypothetical protein n=1 Tax=Streptomyces sp. NPDC057280 TaxID=3346081 RepID=UPI00363E31BE
MATTEAVLTALAELRQDLDTGAWVPDGTERALATVTRADGSVSAEAIRAGLRAVGPDGAAGRLAPVLAHWGAILAGLSGTSSAVRQTVAVALDDVLDEVVLAGL